MPKTAGFFCVHCRGERLHAIKIHRHPDGKVTRARECSACQNSTDLTYQDPLAGIACPVCGDIRLKTVYTRHKRGVTVRVKRCRHCCHRIRTAERFESLAHAGQE